MERKVEVLEEKNGYTHVIYKKPVRGFEVVSKYSLKTSVKMPCRSTGKSAGYDLFNNFEDITIKAHSTSEAISTCLKVYMKDDEYVALYPRSSYGFKFNARLVNSVAIIDSDYYNNKKNEGEIFVKIHNHGDKDLVIPNGQAFAQAIFNKYLLTDTDSETRGGERIGGIGSTTTGPR